MTGGRPDGCPARGGLALGITVAAVTVLLVAGAALLASRTGSHGDHLLLPFTVSCGTLGGLLVALRPRNRLGWVFALVAAAFTVDAATAPTLYPRIFPMIQLLPTVVIAAAAIAILGHRLFDIDLLINRTLFYSTLTITLLAGYLLAVGWLRSVFHAGDGGIVALIATGLVAVAFAPQRDQLQRLVNRLLYRHGGEPYKD
jgi:hypothetical protein